MDSYRKKREGFRRRIKVEQGNMENIPLEFNTEQEQLEYEEYKRKRYAEEIHKEKWENARKRMEGDER